MPPFSIASMYLSKPQFMREFPRQWHLKKLTTLDKLELFMTAKRHFKQMDKGQLPDELELKSIKSPYQWDYLMFSFGTSVAKLSWGRCKTRVSHNNDKKGNIRAIHRVFCEHRGFITLLLFFFFFFTLLLFWKRENWKKLFVLPHQGLWSLCPIHHHLHQNQALVQYNSQTHHISQYPWC